MKRKQIPTIGAFVLAGLAFEALAQTAATDWPSYGRDETGARFSPLTQITPANVGKLKVAWRYHMRPPEAAAEDPAFFGESEATPLVVGGVMYLPTPYGRVVALDASTGKELWSYKLPNEDSPPLRGVAYWPGDSSIKPRILFGTRAGKLIALDASNGTPVAGFGEGGILEMKTPDVTNGVERPALGMTSPPLIVRNLVITGSRVQENPPLGVAGDVRAWDVKTGKLVWTFRTVPRPGEMGHETWEGESWKNRSGANAWTSLVADVERGIVYLPIGTPAFDRWGGDRKGANLFGNSIVAVDAATGKYLWHFQTVHHDLWDLDLPSITLLDVKKDGRTIPAIAVMNKNPLLFLLDRVTGKPIYDVKEVPVPTETDIPGEVPWPTQPMPVAPPPLGRMSFQMSELADLTPEVKSRCEQIVKEWKVVESKVYQPPLAGAAVAHFPGGQGGASWHGATVDPTRGYYVVGITNMGSPAQLAKQPAGHYALAFGYRYFWDGETRILCQRPPWGELIAVDVNSGGIAWRKPVGITENLPKHLQNTGRPLAGGPTATAGGVIFMGGTDDKYVRAFDTSNGNMLWEMKLPASIYATPMTYQTQSGKQFVAFVATGGMTQGDPTGDEVIAVSLP